MTMTDTKTKSVPFDPGFAQHTTILSISLEYMYAQINQFKNFGQRKMKFKMYYPNFVKMVSNNVGFCLGCMLWAVYIKAEKGATIEGNPCLGDTYDRDETVEEIDYCLNYFNQLQKDAKYYLGQTYEVNSLYVKIMELYKEFLTENKNFVSTKTTDDLVIPSSFKTPSESSLEVIKTKIDEVIKSGNLIDLTKILNLVYEG